MHLSGKPPLKQGIPIKAVEDHHVDRPRVEALQSVEPIGTNSLIVLFILRIYYSHHEQIHFINRLFLINLVSIA